MAESIVESIIRRMKELEQGDQHRVKVVDFCDGPQTWVTFQIDYIRTQIDDKPISHSCTEQVVLVIHWVSEHLWSVDVSNGTGCWTVCMEADPLGAFYMAVGFALVNFDG